ncbi:hypothetical protein EMCRGX_G006416 [Ephydatia muelleri]
MLSVVLLASNESLILVNEMKKLPRVVDSCGQYFDRGSSKKKLDTFLIFFQAEHLVVDTIESLCPSLTLFPNPRKAYECAHTRERQFRENLGEGASVEDGEEEEEVAKSKPEEERDFEAAKVRMGHGDVFVSFPDSHYCIMYNPTKRAYIPYPPPAIGPSHHTPYMVIGSTSRWWQRTMSIPNIDSFKDSVATEDVESANRQKKNKLSS